MLDIGHDLVNLTVFIAHAGLVQVVLGWRELVLLLFEVMRVF